MAMALSVETITILGNGLAATNLGSSWIMSQLKDIHICSPFNIYAPTTNQTSHLL